MEKKQYLCTAIMCVMLQIILMSLGKTILVVTGLVLIAVVLLSVRILFVKNGRFRSMHISDSKAMRERGIGCVQSQDRESRKAKSTAIDVKGL